MLKRWKFAVCVGLFSLSLSSFGEEKLEGPALVPPPPKPGIEAEQEADTLPVPPAPLPAEESKKTLPDPPLPKEYSAPANPKKSDPPAPGTFAIPLEDPVQPTFKPLDPPQEAQTSTETAPQATNEQDYATIANGDQVFDLYDRMRSRNQPRPFCDGIGHTITAAKLVNCVGGNDNAYRYQLLLSMIAAMARSSDIGFARATLMFQCEARVSRIAAELVCRQGERTADDMVKRLVLAFGYVTAKVEGRSYWRNDQLHNWEAAAQLVQ